MARDVRWSLVSTEAAESLYGVVVGDDGSVDAGATGSKREEIKASRGESPGFDHGELPPLEEQRLTIAETRRKFDEWLSGELGKARGSGR